MPDLDRVVRHPDEVDGRRRLWQRGKILRYFFHKFYLSLYRETDESTKAIVTFRVRLEVEKKYLASTPELKSVALSRLRYVPSIADANASVLQAAREMVLAKMLLPDTDPVALAKEAFAHLDGVTDEWIKNVKVEEVTRGQVPRDRDIHLMAEQILSGAEDSCCQTALAVKK